MRYFLFISFIFLQIKISAQEIIIDAQNTSLEIKEGQLKMGNPGPEGKEIKVNNKYLTYAGKPVIPVMGEVHYSRIARYKWEETILKMKANGINIIAFYVIWIYHEEEKGIFDWTGNKDLRTFVELCQKNGLWAYPRLGPWVHGEVRNGGLPDWIVNQHEFRSRSNDSAYLFYAERWYKEVAQQIQGLMYKDGGPIIGVQLENEYWRGKGGESHIMWLKKTALKYGIDVPLYTITGWKNTSLPEYEVIPLWGGYPAAPWNTNLEKIKYNVSFLFIQPLNDQNIGNREDNQIYQPDYTPYPYFTCELGIGNQLSEHRRPILNPLDGYTISLSMVAAGSNLPGYYVFSGGLNLVGKYSTLEEDKLESGYWNEYPDISYDFQAAIRETGEIALAYHFLKALHYFLNTFGDILAPMHAICPEQNENPDDLQYAFRTNGKNGFLFLSNYYRGYQKTTKKNVQFKLKLSDEQVTIPENPFNIADSIALIWPVNMLMNNLQLQQATAQPITKVQNGKYTDWYFKASREIEVNYIFKQNNISEIRYADETVPISEGLLRVNNIQTGLTNPIEINTEDGEHHRIFTLSEKEALQFWMFQNHDKRLVFLSDANLYFDENGMLSMFGNSINQSIIALNSKVKITESKANIDKVNYGGFQKIQFNYHKRNINLEILPDDLIQEAYWLRTSDGTRLDQSLYNKLFYKELNLENTAEIRKATLYLVTGQACQIRINDRWLNQQIIKNTVNKLDLTGYLYNGTNKCLLRYSYADTSYATAFAIEIEFFNSVKQIFVSDTTWLCTESYLIPAVWGELSNAKKPLIANLPKQFEELAFTPNRYIVKCNTSELKKQGNVYLRINYQGDKARLYHNGRLVADNFNNNTQWSINLPLILGEGITYPFLEFDPLPDNYQIYFDNPPQKEMIGKIQILNYYTESEYHSELKVIL